MISEKNLSEKLGINLKRERLKGRFVEGLHYFKYSPRKIVYNEDAMCVLIRGENGKHIHKEQCDLGQLVSRWAKDSQVNQVTRHQREQKAS